MPGEMAFVPKGPQKTEQERPAGKEITECTPEELGVFGEIAVEGHDRKAARGHAGSRARKKSEERKVKRINKKKDERVDANVSFSEGELSTQRTEHGEKEQENRGNSGSIEYSGKTARG